MFGKTNFTTNLQQELIRLHKEGLKIKAISKRLGYSIACIERWCKKLNLTRNGKCSECGEILSNSKKIKCSKCVKLNLKRRKHTYRKVYEQIILFSSRRDRKGDSSKFDNHQGRLSKYIERANNQDSLFD